MWIIRNSSFVCVDDVFFDECLIKDSDGDCKVGCKHSGNETASSCEKDSCGIYSNVDECLNIEGCSFINGRCSNISECSIKNSDGGCKIGCKHSRNETVLFCEVDLCIFHSLSVCLSFSGCVIFDQLCVAILDDCSGVRSVVDCWSLGECDFFISGFCKKKSLYSGTCSLVGHGVCSNTSECVWDSNNGCVEIKEAVKASQSPNIFVLITISLLKKSFFILF
jgi:hypothetical protein